MRLNPAERDRLLSARLKRELEARGYIVKKSMDGTVTILDGKTKQVYMTGISVEDAGRLFQLWGEDVPEATVEHAEAVADKTGKWPKPPDRDPRTGLDTPEAAAVREKCR